MLKSFLFELGCAVASYREKGPYISSKTVQNDVIEITLLYTNDTGNLSVGLKRTHDGRHRQSRHFFPSIFEGLNKCFTGKNGRVLFFASFESILGSAVQYEYLGGIPTYPSIGSASPAGSIQLRLDSACRSRILEQRANSYFQRIGRLAGKQSTSSFCHQLFYPLLFRYSLGHDDIPELKNWIALLVEAMQEISMNTIENACSLPFQVNLPESTIVDSSHVKFLRFIAYQCFDWFVRPKKTEPEKRSIETQTVRGAKRRWSV